MKLQAKNLSNWAGIIVVTGACVLAAALFLLHFIHPRADFPNFSPWMDYAKYTDEGWYGNAASSYFVRGRWYVPGDFNPGVALPIWPLLEWVLFHFTGVSLTAARILAVAIFGGNLALTYLLVRSWAPRWTALLALVILSCNAFLYCFSRLAILEPLLIFLMLLCWLLALRVPKFVHSWQRRATLVAIGLLLCAMVLTKTTAVFLIPSIVYLLWFAEPLNHRAAVSKIGIVALSGVLPWLSYYFLVVRPHYLADYRYLFTANVYPQPISAGGWFMAFWYALHGALWIDPKLGALAAMLLLLSAVLCRGVWRNPLFAAAFLASAGYIFFIGYHNNMQPRYYQVVAFPIVILVVMALHALFERRGTITTTLATAGVVVLAFTLFVNIRETVWFAFHPQYTFVNAAKNLTRYIDTHQNRNRLLLSISGSNITLVTGLPAICDDFGTLDLPSRIRLYNPGWYAAWNDLDPGTLEDLHTQYNLKEVASFPAYDDEDRDNLILYQLTPLEKAVPPSHPQRRAKRLPMGAELGKAAQVRQVAE